MVAGCVGHVAAVEYMSRITKFRFDSSKSKSRYGLLKVASLVLLEAKEARISQYQMMNQ